MNTNALTFFQHCNIIKKNFLHTPYTATHHKAQYQKTAKRSLQNSGNISANTTLNHEKFARFEIIY